MTQGLKRYYGCGYLHYIPFSRYQRGLVLEPDQWKWSSYRAYAYHEKGPVRVNEPRSAVMNPPLNLAQFARASSTKIKRYRVLAGHELQGQVGIVGRLIFPFGDTY